MELSNLNIIAGKLPKKCRQLVSVWAEIDQQELIDRWNSQHFHKIELLEDYSEFKDWDTVKYQ